MSVLPRRSWIRWTVPVAVAVIAVGTAALVTRITASAEPSLPPRSAASLLADLQSADLTHGSGTVVQTADLGLPQLPSIGGAGSSSLTSLIAGSHTLRVWYGGTSKARVALMGTLGESDVVLNGRDLWTWSSDSNSATHRVLPADRAGSPSQGEAARELAASGLTPAQVAGRALAAIDPTTTVTTDGAAQVAGRNAYELVLAPKDGTSLIGQVRIALDAERHVPLRVQIFAKGVTTPAAEVGFTHISFAKPSDTQFRFSPPPGATVTQRSSPAAAAPKQPAARADQGEPVVSGQGWTTVLQARLPADATAGPATGKPSGATATPSGDPGLAGQFSGVLGALPRTSGAWGSGRLLKSRLFTVLLTDDGRVLAGAVAPERLYQLAAQPMPSANR